MDDGASIARGRGPAAAMAAPPLMPDPNLTPKRPNKLWDLLPTKQLSPIPASPAGAAGDGDAADADSPTQPPPQHSTTGGSRLQLPRLLTPLSRIMNASTLSLLSRHGSRSATPSPMGGPEVRKSRRQHLQIDKLSDSTLCGSGITCT